MYFWFVTDLWHICIYNVSLQESPRKILSNVIWSPGIWSPRRGVHIPSSAQTTCAVAYRHFGRQETPTRPMLWTTIRMMIMWYVIPWRESVDERWLVSTLWMGWDEEFGSEWLYKWVDIWTDVRTEENLKVNVSFVQWDVASVECTINIIE